MAEVQSDSGDTNDGLLAYAGTLWEVLERPTIVDTDGDATLLEVWVRQVTADED